LEAQENIGSYWFNTSNTSLGWLKKRTINIDKPSHVSSPESQGLVHPGSSPKGNEE
jgi:hypothetical protein